MNKKNKRYFGYILMFAGLGIVVGAASIIETSILGLFLVLGVGVPVVLVGSLLSETAPSFIMERYVGV